MEYKEISAISTSLETYLPFGISRINVGEVFCAVSRTKAQILELNYQHHHDGSVRFIQSSAPLPAHIPSQDNAKDSNKIYTQASASERSEMQLNPLLVPEVLNQNELTFAMVATKFAPRYLARNGFHLVCLSNYGGCDVLFKHNVERLWTRVCCLSQIWSAHCRQKYEEPLQRFDDLRKYVDDTRWTALSWDNSICDGQQWRLWAINALGTLILVRLKEISDGGEREMAAEILLETETTMKKVNLLECITFVDEQNEKHTFIVTGDVVGNVMLFPVICHGENIELGPAIDLWNEGDKIRADGLRWTYDSKSKQILLLYCKGSHVFVHLLDKSGGALAHCIQYIEGLAITSKWNKDYQI